MDLLIDQLDYSGSFDYMHIVQLYKFSENDLWSLIKLNI
jgi:hypothetical protein